MALKTGKTSTTEMLTVTASFCLAEYHPIHHPSPPTARNPRSHRSYNACPPFYNWLLNDLVENAADWLVIAEVLHVQPAPTPHPICLTLQRMATFAPTPHNPRTAPPAATPPANSAQLRIVSPTTKTAAALMKPATCSPSHPVSPTLPRTKNPPPTPPFPTI